MTLAELRTEVLARGFDYVTTARVNAWLNRVYHRVCDAHSWAFLEATASGTSPLAIADLRNVLSVVDTTAGAVITWEDLRTIRERDPELEETGNPFSWYLDGGAITAHPVTTNSLSVRYVKVPTDLTADGDTPIIPTRYHYALVDGACALAYRDSDNFSAAADAEAAFFQAVEEMANTILTPNYDSPDEIVITGSSDW